jgi:hypothetical protein
MNLNETKELLKEIAAVDNRKLDAETLTVWHGYVGHLKYEVAREALRLARLDDRVNWLEPRHLSSWASQAGANVAKASTDSIPERGICEHKTDVNYCKICCAKTGRTARTPDPQPICREHQKAILACDACCSALNKFSMEYGFEGLHAFAKKTIYA